MSHLDYLVSILIFAGTANVIIWYGKRERLKQYIKPGLITAAAMVVPLGATEWYALSRGAWVYSPENTFNHRFFGAEIETYIFVLFVAFAIFGATILFTRHEDKHRRPKSKPRKS